MKKLWQKNWKLNVFVEFFETKDDILLDQKLTPFDIVGSLAHAKMLQKIGVLTKYELINATKGFQEIYNLYKKGKFILDFGDEDIHTKIENFLTENYGEIGKKIHTGRSRNDQVLTALRLLTKSGLLDIWESTFSLADALLEFTETNKDIVIPGYTHMQKAMPYTFGAWAEAFVSALIDDYSLLQAAFVLIDQSPLGSAAGFGTPILLDKTYSAQLMGFEKVQENALYCQNSRGKFEAVILATLISILGNVNKFASDVLLFTTSEFNFLAVDSSICTGSSIMPQKKNVDIAELIRSKVHVILGNYNQIIGLSTNLISGYNRDLQDMKKPLIESLEVTNATLQATTILAKSISPNKKALKKSLTPELFTTHKTFALTQQGIPFREAYNIIGKNIFVNKAVETARITIPLHIVQFKKCIEKQKKIFICYQKKHNAAMKNLLQEGGEHI
jgi:argininosuccinate lyase